MGQISVTLTVMPWALHVMAVFVFVAVMFSSRLASPLGMKQGWVAFLVVAAGLVVALTLTPISDPLGSGHSQEAWLGLSRRPLLPSTWWPLDQRALNVLLYVPLGLAIAQVRRMRWLAALIVVAVVTPLFVESVQRLVPAMHRGPEWLDVADNLIGLAVGLVAGLVIRVLSLVAGRTRAR